MKVMMMMVCVIALWGAAGGARSCGESRRVYGEKHSLDTAPHARISGERLQNLLHLMLVLCFDVRE